MPPASRQASVLVIEDQEIVRQMIVDFLVQNSFSVVGASTGAHGLDLLRARLFDAVLLDLGLPDVNGMDLIGRIHAIFPKLPIVMLSGMGFDENLRSQAAAKGAAAFLSKGSDLETILKKLQEALGMPSTASGE